MPYDVNALSGCVILVLEDEYFLADYLTAAIRSAGGSVQGPFASAQEALAQLAGSQARPDAATLNVNVADGPSYAVADALLAAGIPFLFASAHSQASLPERFARVPLLTKPFGAFQAVEALAAILGVQAADWRG